MNDEYLEVAELYDHIVAYQTRSDVTFFVDQAKESGGPVLEVGCGTGRVLVPTARAGIEIVGVDLSPRMLSVCRQKLNQEPAEVRSRVELVEADMRQFDLSRKFSLVTLPFRPFQHLMEVSDQLACLEAIGRHLSRDGSLIVDVFNPWLEMLTRDNIGIEQSAGSTFTLPDGRRVEPRERTVARNPPKQVVSVDLIYLITDTDGVTERIVHSFDMRYFFRYELEHLLVRAGYAVDAVYSDYQRASYGTKYPGELIFVARKI